MKTAISLPDDTFERATRQAKKLHVSRSELFARAAERYLDELDAQELTGQIDAALELTKPDASNADAVAVGKRLLGADADTW